jgi:CubicO group peptidase (beta-lactamase class C family)
MEMKTWVRALLLVVLVAHAPAAQQLPTAAPDTIGVSADRLERLHRGMQTLVDRREVSGMVTLIARDGRIVDVHATGFQDIESKTLMRQDTIFRIASMSKLLPARP